MEELRYIKDGILHIELIPGNDVLCDSCGVSYTDRDDEGGIMFDSKALCPECAPRWEVKAERFDELSHIRARCPKGKSFADWVREDIRP